MKLGLCKSGHLSTHQAGWIETYLCAWSCLRYNLLSLYPQILRYTMIKFNRYKVEETDEYLLATILTRRKNPFQNFCMKFISSLYNQQIHFI
uniref:Uncharacterized protein n=1 Tax=Wuchereria bancrofti TaxID=6293 RepID=A0AAF5PZD3_WUCBA